MSPPMTGDGKELSVKVLDRRVAGKDGWGTEGQADEREDRRGRSDVD